MSADVIDEQFNLSIQGILVTTEDHDVKISFIQSK